METQHRVGIAVDVEDDPQGFAPSIQGMERMEDSVIALRREEVQLRKELQANHQAIIELDKAVQKGNLTQAEAIRMAQQLAQRDGEVNQALKLKAQAARTASVELENMRRAQRDAQQD